jgi:hypothetical protein
VSKALSTCPQGRFLNIPNTTCSINLRLVGQITFRNANPAGLCVMDCPRAVRSALTEGAAIPYKRCDEPDPALATALPNDRTRTRSEHVRAVLSVMLLVARPVLRQRNLR